MIDTVDHVDAAGGLPGGVGDTAYRLLTTDGDTLGLITIAKATGPAPSPRAASNMEVFTWSPSAPPPRFRGKTSTPEGAGLTFLTEAGRPGPCVKRAGLVSWRSRGSHQKTRDVESQ